MTNRADGVRDDAFASEIIIGTVCEHYENFTSHMLRGVRGAGG